jgi:plasmid stabilization system protein ParE
MRVDIRPQARDEIDDAAAWYERERPGLGVHFVQAVISACSSIADQPSAYPQIRRGARRFVMKQFPYLIVYRQERDAIVVYGCIHSHRDPKHWQRRL